MLIMSIIAYVYKVMLYYVSTRILYAKYLCGCISLYIVSATISPARGIITQRV